MDSQINVRNIETRLIWPRAALKIAKGNDLSYLIFWNDQANDGWQTYCIKNLKENKYADLFIEVIWCSNTIPLLLWKPLAFYYWSLVLNVLPAAIPCGWATKLFPPWFNSFLGPHINVACARPETVEVKHNLATLLFPTLWPLYMTPGQITQSCHEIVTTSMTCLRGQKMMNYRS